MGGTAFLCGVPGGRAGASLALPRAGRGTWGWTAPVKLFRSSERVRFGRHGLSIIPFIYPWKLFPITIPTTIIPTPTATANSTPATTSSVTTTTATLSSPVLHHRLHHHHYYHHRCHPQLTSAVTTVSTTITIATTTPHIHLLDQWEKLHITSHSGMLLEPRVSWVPPGVSNHLSCGLGAPTLWGLHVL